MSIRHAADERAGCDTHRKFIWCQADSLGVAGLFKVVEGHHKAQVSLNLALELLLDEHCLCVDPISQRVIGVPITTVLHCDTMVEQPAGQADGFAGQWLGRPVMAGANRIDILVHGSRVKHTRLRSSYRLAAVLRISSVRPSTRRARVVFQQSMYGCACGRLDFTKDSASCRLHPCKIKIITITDSWGAGCGLQWHHQLVAQVFASIARRHPHEFVTLLAQTQK